MSAVDWADDPQHWLRVRAERGETDAAAAYMILASPLFAPRVASFIGDGHYAGTIKFEQLLNGGWSSGERALLELAAHLWNSTVIPAIDLDYLLRALDEGLLAVALTAMTARHGGPLLIGGTS